MKRLLIDTSTNAQILILSNNQKVIDSTFEIVKRDHSTTLMPNIDRLLERNGFDVKDLEEIIVTEGPGSYTGVRIGVTVAKTLSYALHIPLHTVSTLKLMSASFIEEEQYIAPIIDARRGNVFGALYQVKNQKLECVIDDVLVNYDDFLTQIKQKTSDKVYIVGLNLDPFKVENEQFRYCDAYKESFRPNLVMKLDFNEVQNIHQFVPSYKRLPEAEINLK